MVQPPSVPGLVGSGRILPGLEGLEDLRISSHQPDPESPDQDQRRGSRRCDRPGSPLAEETLVQPPAHHGSRAASEVQDPARSPHADPHVQRQALSPRPGAAELGCLEVDRRHWRRAGFSKAVTRTAMAALRPTTRLVYDLKWRIYAAWCKRHRVDPISAPLTQVLRFLQAKADKGYGARTLAGYVTSISRRHCMVKCSGKRCRVSKGSTVQAWSRGIAVLNPRPRVIVPVWSLDLVLSALKRPPYFPLKECELKYLTMRTAFLMAVTSARRASELQAICCDTMVWRAHEVIAYTDPEFLPKVHSANVFSSHERRGRWRAYEAVLTRHDARVLLAHQGGKA